MPPKVGANWFRVWWAAEVGQSPASPIIEQSDTLCERHIARIATEWCSRWSDEKRGQVGIRLRKPDLFRFRRRAPYPRRIERIGVAIGPIHVADASEREHTNRPFKTCRRDPRAGGFGAIARLLL